MTTYAGVVNGAVFNHDEESNSSYAAVTAKLKSNTVSNYTVDSVPVISPYGFISVPDDNQQAAYGSLGNGGYAAQYVFGFTNQQKSDSNLAGLAKGETALFSRANYTLQIKNDRVLITFTNGNEDVVTSELAIDKNVVTVLIDLVAEINALEEKTNDIIEVQTAIINSLSTLYSAFGSHTHSPGTFANSGGAVGGVSGNIVVPTPAPSITPNDPYVPTDNFVRDDDFMGADGEKMFVQPEGELIE